MASTVLLVGRVSRIATDLLADALAPLGLRPRHYGTLMALAEHGPASQQRLGRGLLIDRTTMVGVVDDLERLGLVVRATDPDDRRAYRVELTGRGRTRLVRATGAVARAERSLLAGLSADEQGQLRALLRRVAAQQGGTPEPGDARAAADGRAAAPAGPTSPAGPPASATRGAEAPADVRSGAATPS
jgi:DNA-binding MarR family transcriptional regulator